jgi:hypothetical protein
VLSLILADGTRIRHAIKSEYEKLRRQIEKARTELARFEAEDVPAYRRWFHGEFGSLLTELRETSQRLHELETIFFEVESEILFTGASPSAAYARARERRENPEAPPEDTEETDEDNGPEFPFGEDFGKPPPGFDDFASEREPSRRRSKGKASSPATARRLKEIYRALARRLHPDAQREMTAQKREWWHQAQAAYLDADVEQLEVILVLCEIEETGNADKASLSVLQRISAHFKKSLRQLRSQLTKSKRDPAWNFSQCKDLTVLTESLRRRMHEDLRRMKAELLDMEAQIAAWNRPDRRRHSYRGRRRAPNPFGIFF